MRTFVVAFVVFQIALLINSLHGEAKFDRESTPGKLPKEIIPKAYLIHLEPRPENLLTNGYEQINIEVLRPTDRIVFNAAKIEISSVKLSGKPNLEEDLTPVFDETAQTVALHPKARLEVGNYKLTFTFQSKIDEQGRGLFVQSYQAQGVHERLLATQMESADARRMFPCWDEPSFRALFRLTVLTEQSNTVVSNMPILASQPIGGDQKIVIFDQTVPMVSYLVVLICGKLEWLEDEVAGIKLRILTAPGKKELAQYALEVTKKVLPFYNDYFGLPYPLPKLDQIALPSEFQGGMENWGGITYNESALLFDPKTSSESTKQEIFETIAHEIAHQWFGNLVTMAWWDNLWLNEGFASWMETKATDHFNPDWQIWLRANEVRELAMNLDSRKTTHPIQQPIEDGIGADDAFDAITYNKAQCFIRMLENFLGENAFREGIRAYIKNNQYSNTTTANLWEALEIATGKPVGKIASTWTEQPGFPLIKMTAQCISGKQVISLEQVRLMLGDPDKTPVLWSVPVSIFSTAKPDDVKYALLEKVTNNYDFPGCDGTLKANAGGIGFYRVLYEPTLFLELQKSVLKLSQADRLNLITDTWALVESGNMQAANYLDLLSHLQEDNSLAIWESAIGTESPIGAIRLIDRLEQGQPGRERFQKYICQFLAPKFVQLGWDQREGDDNQVRLLRALVLENLGFFGDKAVIDEAFKRFELFQLEPNSLAPDLRPAVMRIVGRYSSEGTYGELTSLLERTEKTEEKKVYLRALAAVLDPDLAKRTIALFNSSKVSPDEAALGLAYLATEGEHPEMAWDYLGGHLGQMKIRFGLTRQNQLFPAIAEGFTDEAKAAELVAFVKNHLPGASLKEVENAANLIVVRARLKAKELPAIDKWTEDNGR
jgi:aminopeptidase N